MAVDDERAGSRPGVDLVARHPAEPRSAVGWRWLRLGAFGIWVAVILAIVIGDGVPTGVQTIALLIIWGLCLTAIGESWQRLRQILFDWLPFTLVLVAYDKTRAVADAVGMPLHEHDIVRAESWLFHGTVPTVWLQHHLYSPAHIHWYDALCTLIYTSHFLATPVLAAALWLRERRAFLQFISRVIVLSLAGLITYILFPEAPPWLASRDGDIAAHVVRLSARGWSYLHLGNVKEALARAQTAGSNPVASMPSLHMAFACLLALVIAGRLRSRWRWLLVLYPLAMGFALVYLGEHYVLDLVAGFGYAVAVHLGLNRWEARRARRAVANAAGVSAADVTPNVPDSGGRAGVLAP